MVAINKYVSSDSAIAMTKSLKLHKRPLEKTEGREERQPRKGRTLRGIDLHTRPQLVFTKEMLLERINETATRHDLESSVTSSLPVRHPGNIFIILGAAQRASMQGNEQMQLANVKEIHANSLQMLNVNAALKGLAANMKKISAEESSSKDGTGHDDNVWQGIGDWFKHFAHASKDFFTDGLKSYGLAFEGKTAEAKKDFSKFEKASNSFQKFQKNNKAVSVAIGVMLSVVAVSVLYVGACVLTAGVAAVFAPEVVEGDIDVAVTADDAVEVAAQSEGGAQGAGEGGAQGAGEGTGEGAEGAEGAEGGTESAPEGGGDAAGNAAEGAGDSSGSSAATTDADASADATKAATRSWGEFAQSFVTGGGNNITFIRNWAIIGAGLGAVSGMLTAAGSKEKLSFSNSGDGTEALSAEVQADSTESMIMSQVAQSFQQDDSVAMSNLSTLNSDNQAAASFAASSAQSAKQVDNLGNMF